MNGYLIAGVVTALIYVFFFLLVLAALLKFASKEPLAWKLIGSALWPLVALAIFNVRWAERLIDSLYTRFGGSGDEE